MLDESGDLNPVTLEIFKLLPATRKVMVGDQHQNIYTFNHTINCFKEMEDEGVMFPMTQSFRVADYIADRIQRFCRTYIDKNMEFKGIQLRNSEIKTRAYIARTNGQLISKMIEFNETGVNYSLSRPAKSIFRVPLLLCGLKNNGIVADPEYHHIQEDVNNYYSSTKLMEDYSLYGYLKEVHEDDVSLQAALNTINTHGVRAVINCYDKAQINEKLPKTDYMICSAHSAKGLEFDEVTLAPDMERSIADTLNAIDLGLPLEDLTEEERSELNLFYVACSRARKKLIGVSYL
jgi:superfamily I DNA/RNA helicase